MSFFPTLLVLLLGHALADYAWQGDFMAKAKNRASPLPSVPFYQPLIAHCAIHGGLVYLVTGSLWMAFAEMVIHGFTDDAKCMGRITYNTDQAIHVACKVLWATIAFMVSI